MDLTNYTSNSSTAKPVLVNMADPSTLPQDMTFTEEALISTLPRDMTFTEEALMSTLPRDMTFTEEALMSVIVYSVLFVIASIGNLTVFITLFRNRHRRSRVNLFIMHLSIADLLVTLVIMPIEVAWHLTVSWNAGDVACRIFMFFRAFGFYLSSFILVAISLDRYFAIAHPLSLNDADRRGKLMLFMAWLFSVTASIPQVRLYDVIISWGKQPAFLR